MNNLQKVLRKNKFTKKEINFLKRKLQNGHEIEIQREYILAPEEKEKTITQIEKTFLTKNGSKKFGAPIGMYGMNILKTGIKKVTFVGFNQEKKIVISIETLKKRKLVETKHHPVFNLYSHEDRSLKFQKKGKSIDLL